MKNAFDLNKRKGSFIVEEERRKEKEKRRRKEEWADQQKAVGSETKCKCYLHK